ncbi:unnamed protein product, partial [Polarella glacialis]
ELNKSYGTEMLISHTTFSRLDDLTTLRLLIRPIDIVYLIPEAPLEDRLCSLVYQVFEPSRQPTKAAAQSKAVGLQHQAIQCYRDRDFGRAAELFKQVKSILVTQDTAAGVMLKRSQSYAKKPPPADWDGVWDRGSEAN